MNILELVTQLEAARHGIAARDEIDLKLEDAAEYLEGRSYRFYQQGYFCGFRVDERERNIFIY